MQNYGYLKDSLDDYGKQIGDRVAGWPKGPTAACAACAAAGHEGHPLDLNLDFNFSLRHYAKCGTSDLDAAPPNQNRFVPGQELREFVAASSAAGYSKSAPDAGCSDFGAATAFGRTNEAVSVVLNAFQLRSGPLQCLSNVDLIWLFVVQLDVTAVGVLMCRHGFALLLIDIATGERYIYGIFLLCYLMFSGASGAGLWGCSTASILAVGVLWYDINCRFGAFLRRWATQMLGEEERAAVHSILTPLPCFHRYAHR